MVNKLKSIKNLLLIWIVGIITYVVITEKYNFLPLIQNLSWATLGYFGANTFQKKIFSDQEIKSQILKGKQNADSKSKP